MNAILVVNHERDWPVEVPGLIVVSARKYLSGAAYSENHHRARVFNLCRTERYQGRGYYVSLLAEARGHRPMPEAKTISDLQADQLGNLRSSGFREQIQRALAGNVEDKIVIEAYFGRDPLRLNDSLSQQLFGVLRAPLIRASFARHDGEWSLTHVQLLGATDIAADRRLFVAQAATEFIARSRVRIRDFGQDPSLAILYNNDEPNPEGLVVVDDPDSILKCTNKVYVNELLTRHRVPVPKTLMVHRDNVDQIVPVLGLPCVIKQPDGAFSLGVSKIESSDQLRSCVDKLFAKSDLLIAQEWLPTAFDWRVGVYDRRPLYVCKYFMAPGHWQVIKREAGCQSEGLTQALSIGEAPEIVVKTGLRAANLIGDGLYGVDLKETADQCYVMEVNDNPNVDAGKEDGVLENALYRELMGVFLRRIRERKRATSP